MDTRLLRRDRYLARIKKMTSRNFNPKLFFLKPVVLIALGDTPSSRVCSGYSAE